ncbi:MAG: efflux RND transporter periplasmic adaptor subunit [Verrucomicrobiota bacterium]
MKVMFAGSLSLVALLAGCAPAPEEESPRVLLVEVETAQKQSSAEKPVSYFGLVEPRQTSELSFELSGTVDEILVDEGERMTAGQELALLDSTRLEARIQAAQAAVKEAEAGAKLSGITLDRLTRLVERDAASVQELDEARQARETALASIDRLSAEVDALQVDLEKSTLIAPYDGTVAQRYLDSGASVGPAQPVLQVMEDGHLEAKIGVSPVTARTYQPGDPLEIVDSSGRSLGEIARVARVASKRDNRTRTVDLIVDIESSETLLPGDPIEVILKESEDLSGFWVPRKALSENVRGMWALFVLEEDETSATKVSRRPIEILFFETDRAYIQGPLQDGDQYIVSGLHRLVPGQQVAIKLNE